MLVKILSGVAEGGGGGIADVMPHIPSGQTSTTVL